jgi:serine/threonine protein kinase/tetratricopeptide (TPR) repeat protein
VPESNEPATIGRYRILGRLGEGGMGVVYEAHDERLDRSVALKLMREAGLSQASVDRFWREARAAAAVSHPHICQIFEIGEDGGRPFIVMERLRGETLADRLRGGPLPPREAASLLLGLLEALDALHGRGVVHRDLKPSNVFLTPHGVKLLDFGLVRDRVFDDASATHLTHPGLIVGTPRYMAPEQIAGAAIDGRTDLFAAGLLLFEMLSGQPAFGAGGAAVLHQVLHEQPPALVGSPLVAALDGVVHKAIAKRADERYSTAGAMAAAVRDGLALDDSGEAPRVLAMTRIVVLPFRLLRPDSETEFLAFSLPDAITASLSAYEGISVRTPLAAARLAGDTPDLRVLAEQLDVDHVLTGTLLRSGDLLRVTAQLVQAPGGRVIWSHSAQAPLGELFELQDTFSHGIVSALPVAGSAAARLDVPRTPRAYDLYLRANELALESSTYRLARSMYERCLEEDPAFAPAWARLGRVLRVIGKYLEPGPSAAYAEAERAFDRALALNPELSIAHSLSSYLLVETGRAEDAMVRLLARLAARPADPELLSALVHACRYCGLLDASAAAHERARRLDPQVRTSVLHTWFAMGDYERCLEESQWLTDPLLALALVALGRLEEATHAIAIEEERFAGNSIERAFVSHLRGFVGGSRDEAAAELDRMKTSGFRDGEGVYYRARSYAALGFPERALDTLQRAVEVGFFSYPTLRSDPWLDSLRAERRFVELIAAAAERHQRARNLFESHRGASLLGLRAAS